MGNPELCILLDSILALLETDNTEKAKEVIKNGIKRIDRGSDIRQHGHRPKVDRELDKQET